jgi:xylan 1,4-beta-xylosidase
MLRRVAHAQVAATVSISVDGTSPGAPLERVWPYYGFDEANYATNASGQELLKTLVASHTAPVHIRTHFLLNTGDGSPSLKWGSTNVYTESTDGTPIYSWALMDGIFDAITNAGAFPFAEIAFMPQALSTMPSPYRNSTTYSLDGGSFYPPKDYGKWSSLVEEWATHSSTRYPNVENAWLWELWNEPDIGYWHGTFEEYAKLYDTTEAALHRVLPNAQLGGPAVAVPGGTFLTQFLAHCANEANTVSGQPGTRLDFISFHAKGGVVVTDEHVEMNLGNQLRLHQAGMSTVADSDTFRATPIYITEADPDGCAACPVSMNPANAYRNSPAYGTYEVAMMARTLELQTLTGVNLEGILTWAFTFPGTPYYAGYRALTTNGIDLPVLGAFKLLGALDGLRLPVNSDGRLSIDEILTNSVRKQPDIDAMATLNSNRIQVLLWNYHDDLVAAPASPVQLSVKVPASFGSSVSVTHLRVDDTHGNAYAVWTSLGSPTLPTAQQQLEMQQAMAPTPLGAAQSVTVAAGTVRLNFDLPRFALSLLTLEAKPNASTPDTAASTPSNTLIYARGGGCACEINSQRRPGTGDGSLFLLLGIATLVTERRRIGAARLSARRALVCTSDRYRYRR